MAEAEIKNEFEEELRAKIQQVLDSVQTLPDGTTLIKFEDGSEYRRPGPRGKVTQNKETALPEENMKPEDAPDSTHFEKYIDARFAHIDNAIGDIKADMRDIRSGITGLRSWIISTAIVLFATIIALFTYHATIIQSQMHLFSDYVKAITQPVLPETKLPDKK